MADTSAITSLRTVVNKARLRGGIPESKDGLCFQLAIDAMRDLSLFHMTYKNIVKVTPDSLGRVYFPDDCLKFLSLGTPYDGKFYTFTRNKMLVRSSDKTYAYESLDSDYGEGQAPANVFFYTYGKGGGAASIQFFVDDRKRYAQIVGFTGTECTLHYISSGITENVDGVEIPRIAEEAIIAFVLWQVAENDPATPVGVKIRKEQLYANALTDIDMLNYAPTMDEIMDEYYSSLYQTIKRI